MAYKDYFTKGTKQHKIKNILLIISISLVIFLYLEFTFSFLYLEFTFSSLITLIDFPCVVSIEQGYLKGNYRTEDIKYAELFVTTRPAHNIGGGCLHESLSNYESTNIGKYNIQIKDDKLLIDNKSIEIGQTWNKEETRFSILDPWWIYKDYISLKNEGFVKGSKLYNGTTINFDNDVLVINGYKGTEGSLNFLTLIIFLLNIIIFILLLISTIVYLIKNKTSR